MAFAAQSPRKMIRSLPEPAELELLCFPCAGGSALMFRDWGEQLPATVEVRPWEPPGRGVRLREAAFRGVDEIVEEAVEALGSNLHRPFALLGHSLGGLVAFEFARALRRHGLAEPCALIVAAASAPQAISRLRRRAHPPSDDELIETLRGLNGTPEAVLRNRRLIRVFLPSLRADLQAVEYYSYLPEPPLSAPIYLFSGLDDRMIDRESMRGWEELTTGAFRHEWLAGDHFFPNNSRPAFMQLLNRALARLLQESRERPAA